MLYGLFALLLGIIAVPAAHAGIVASTPEVDPGTLAGVGSAIAGTYFTYQIWSAKRAAKNSRKS